MTERTERGGCDVPRLRAHLESAVSGEVHTEPHHTSYYSVDASSYMVRPDIIVTPKDGPDVAETIAAAGRFGTSVTPRGGGTGLVGGALNTGIILDMRLIDGIEVDPDAGTVTAGAGAPRGRLDAALDRHGMMFAPNPSVGPFCTVGGMVANNAAGSRSLKYGSTIHNTVSITMIDGSAAAVALPENREVGRAVLRIAGAADTGRFPAAAKNSSGYRLDAVRAIRDTHRALVGSEGTLGAIMQAELAIVRKPGFRVLYVLQYASEEDAAADCARIVGRTGPSAAEFVDRTILESMDMGFGDDAKCLLFVEYDDNNMRDGCGRGRWEEVGQSAQGRIADVIRTTDEAEMSQWWRHRDAALHYSITALKSDPGMDGRVPHVIEDAAVPAAALPELFAALRSINDRHGTRTITYGHMGSGNIHVRLVSSRKNPANMQEIAERYFAGVVALGGSIAGEHGDGLARSEFVGMQYGKANMRQFARLKELFDPMNVMNPGKIVGGRAGTMSQNVWDFSGRDGRS